MSSSQSGAPPVFRADQPGAGSPAASPALDHAAELIAHKGAETPLTLGLFGAAGAGKTHAMARLVERARALAGAASGAGPFVSRLVVARLSAPAIADETPGAIAAALFETLAAPGQGRAAFARAAAHAAIDPRAAARDANRQLDDTRRQLDAERRGLEEIDGRRARLPEVLLYEAAGSGVDAYARSNRAAIEARLRRFGFHGDPVATYKDLVRDVAGHDGLAGRVSAFFRALWAFEGQGKLLVRAIALFLLAWAAGLAEATSGSWLGSLRAAGPQAEPAAAWIGEHLSWFGWLRMGAIVLACLCVLANVWRAFHFLTPLWRGARLLRGDIETRKRELDAQIAHQTRRVDALSADAEAHARVAAEAEKRAGQAAGEDAGLTAERLFPEADSGAGARRAAAFVESLSAAMTRGGDATAPQRVLVVLDDLDGLPPARAAGLVESVFRLVSRPGFALLVCADPAHLAAGWNGAAEAAQRLRRLVQIPLSVALPGGDDALRDYARGLLEGAAGAPAPAPDATRSALDAPLTPAETLVVAALAPLAGETPRAVKRFVNIWRLARARGGDSIALALMLTLDCGGETGELNALGAAMAHEDGDRDLFIHPGEPRLAAALDAVNAARGKKLSVAEAEKAWALASDYRTPM